MRCERYARFTTLDLHGSDSGIEDRTVCVVMRILPHEVCYIATCLGHVHHFDRYERGVEG